MRLLHMLATVGLLTSVGVTIVDAAEPSQSGPPLLVPVTADGVQRATVTLDSYSYTPNHLIVEAGKPVELTILRKDGKTETVSLPPHFQHPFMGQTFSIAGMEPRMRVESVSSEKSPVFGKSFRLVRTDRFGLAGYVLEVK